MFNILDCISNKHIKLKTLKRSPCFRHCRFDVHLVINRAERVHVNRILVQHPTEEKNDVFSFSRQRERGRIDSRFRVQYDFVSVLIFSLSLLLTAGARGQGGAVQTVASLDIRHRIKNEDEFLLIKHALSWLFRNDKKQSCRA